jgi:hypothetical protein
MPQSEPKHPQGETPSLSLDWASKRVASWLPGFIFIIENYAIIIEYLALLVNPSPLLPHKRLAAHKGE